MKKLSLYVFLVLLWCNVGFAEERIINRPYCGHYTYGDGLSSFKVITKFFISREDNSIFGIYTSDEFGEVYEGVLFKGKLKDEKLTILTTDEHMHGKANLIFTDNFNSFQGMWISDDGVSSGNWVGETGEFCKE